MKIPVSEILGSIPGTFGIRLEEEPAHSVITKEGPFEIRKYESVTLAHTTVDGDRDTAMDEGFDRLASFIFGENIGMKKLDMTTPVLQENAGRAWKLSFILPSEFTTATAPVPLDKRISVEAEAGKTIAACRYTGNNTIESMREAEGKLLRWLEAKGLTPAGPVRWAQYDQPFAVPFLKRNEAQVELKIDQGMSS